MNEQVIKEIKRRCGKVTMLKNGWCQFAFQQIHFVYIPDDRNEMIRISVPHIDNINNFISDILEAAVNETNRNIKYIKVVILNNGSISLNYDHKMGGDENIEDVVSHMIDSLFGASRYLMRKLTH